MASNSDESLSTFSSRNSSKQSGRRTSGSVGLACRSTERRTRPSRNWNRKINVVKHRRVRINHETIPYLQIYV